MTKDNKPIPKWRIPVLFWAKNFNQRNSQIQILKYCSQPSLLDYIHLDFIPTEHFRNLSKKVLSVAVTHLRDYHLSGNFRIEPIEFLPAESNKQRAREISRIFLNAGFHETDEETTPGYSRVMPHYNPHLVHRYDRTNGEDEYSDSELYFEPFELDRFRDNVLEQELKRFIGLVEDK